MTLIITLTATWVIAGIGGVLLASYLHVVAGILFTLVVTGGYVFLKERRRLSASAQKSVPSFMNIHPLLAQCGVNIRDTIDTSINEMEVLTGIQSDAIANLTRSFQRIQVLLDQQQADIQSQLNTIRSAILVLNEPITPLDVARLLTVKPIDPFSHELSHAIQVAIRALQFEDMSNQSILHSIESMSMLRPLADSLEHSSADLNETALALKDAIDQYQACSRERHHNPVSAASVQSGDVELF